MQFEIYLTTSRFSHFVLMVMTRLVSAIICGLEFVPLLPVQASFYVCPEGCAAMLLPRDMELITDCLCGDTVDISVEEAAANALNTEVFACKGRYKRMRGIAVARSVADCDCYHPYEKDPKTLECVLTSCPRAGNYESATDVARVTSLADCTCTAPYVKVETSGQCVLADETKAAESRGKYQCPPNSTPTPDVVPRSFADCHCSWGFVRNSLDKCEREHAAYVCPVNSVKRVDLPIGERPRGFFDCECLATGEYTRDEQAHACWPVQHQKTRTAKRRNTREDRPSTPYECPPFSLAVATVPHSVEQCRCIPGYAWKLPEMTCVRASAYTCSEHAYKRTSLPETSFKDCACARGYYLDAEAARCVPWMLANANTCPPFAVLTQWPLQSKANCKCLYGLNETIQREENAFQLKTEAQQLATLEETPTIQHSKKECNTRVVDSLRADFSQCPRDSMATTWPVISAEDCTCLYGFDMAPLSEQEIARGVGDGFHCIASPEKSVLAHEAAAACHAPQVVHPFSGACRLPVEEIPPPNAAKKRPSRKPEGVVFKGIEYDYELVDDLTMVIQGDVAIGDRFVWTSIRPDDEEEDTTRVEYILHGYYNSGRDHRWPHGKLCFQVDQSARPFVRTLMSATEHITHATGFSFQRCRGDHCPTDTSCRSHDFIVVHGVESSCYSYVGRIGGPQRLGLSADCGLGNAVHVMLHAVGLRHTVDRIDRDEHVRIAWECIPESKRSYFVVEDTTTLFTTNPDINRLLEVPPYDLFSIMHHPVDAFVHSVSNDIKPQWCPSVIPLIPDKDQRLAVMREMGQRERMTISDVKSVWALYPDLRMKHQQQAGKSGEAQAEDLHDSFLHTKENLMETQSAAAQSTTTHAGFGQRLVSFLGAIVTLVGFGALLAFITTEVRRRSMLTAGDDIYFETPLIDSKNDI